MGRKRRQPQQSRSQVTVEAILDSVSRVIHNQGMAAVTTNRIAETAGVSIGTLYQYFSNKQDIFNALQERNFGHMAGCVKNALMVTEKGSLDNLLVSLIDAVIQERLEDPKMHRFLASTVPRRPEMMSKTHPLFEAFYLAIAAHRDELPPDCNLDRFVFLLSHMINSLANAVVLSRPESVTLNDARAATISAIRAVVAMEMGGLS